jgi:5-hydroxyisourate hydrolase
VSALSTHVLDIARGLPASGIAICLYALGTSAGERHLLAEALTNADGRTDAPLAPRLPSGTYEITYDVAAYFARTSQETFYEEIPVRVRIDGAVARYHVPLLLSPWGYSTYRGS